MRCYARDVRSRTRGVFSERVGNARLLGKIVGAVSVEVKVRVSARHGRAESLDGQREKNILGPFSDRGVRVSGQDGKQLDAILRTEARPSGTDGNFLFEPRVAGPDLSAQLGANGKLRARVPAQKSNSGPLPCFVCVGLRRYAIRSGCTRTKLQKKSE
jgi:hypothetical protein